MNKKATRGALAILAGLYLSFITLFLFSLLDLHLLLTIFIWLMALVLFWLPWYALIIKLDKAEKEIETLKAEIDQTNETIKEPSVI